MQAKLCFWAVRAILYVQAPRNRALSLACLRGYSPYCAHINCDIWACGPLQTVPGATALEKRSAFEEVRLPQGLGRASGFSTVAFSV